MTRHAFAFRRRAALVATAGLLFLLVGAHAFAQGTEEQQTACAGDAFTLCRGDIPDVAKITACMREHKSQLTSKCRVVFDASDPAGPKVAEHPAPKAAERSPAKLAERRHPAAERTHPAARPVVAARPRRIAPEAVPPRPEPAPVAAPAPAPSSTPGLDSYRASIVASCRQGLIDPYTCRSTLEVLKGFE